MIDIPDLAVGSCARRAAVFVRCRSSCRRTRSSPPPRANADRVPRARPGRRGGVRRLGRARPRGVPPRGRGDGWSGPARGVPACPGHNHLEPGTALVSHAVEPVRRRPHAAAQARGTGLHAPAHRGDASPGRGGHGGAAGRARRARRRGRGRQGGAGPSAAPADRLRTVRRAGRVAGGHGPSGRGHLGHLRPGPGARGVRAAADRHGAAGADRAQGRAPGRRSDHRADPGPRRGRRPARRGGVAGHCCWSSEPASRRR
jgi:hypothetical protein